MVTRPRNLPQADPYFDSVVLLVPFSGEDGVTTSTDLSNSAHALTFNGTAALDSDIRKYGFTSLLLDGNSDYVTAAQDASFDFGSSDFTVEGWVRWDAIPGAVDKNNFLGFWDANGVNQRSWLFSLHDRNLRFLYSTNGTAVTQINRSWTPSADTWYHVAACRDSGTIRLFIDGVQQGADVSAASAFHSPTSLLYIGVASTGSGLTEYMNGWHEGWRITKGVARYTSTFTPPERAYPKRRTSAPVKNGLILHLDPANSECFGSGETTATNLITGGSLTGASGTPGTGAHTPAPANFPAYSSLNGGIFDFAGGRGMNVEEDLGSYTAMSLEMWYYKNSAATTQYLADARNDGGQWFLTNYTSFNITWQSSATYNFDTTYDGANTDFINRWQHLIMTSDATGSKLYIDGTERTLLTSNSLAETFGVNYRIGTRYTTSGEWTGYMGPIRLYNRVLSLSEVKQNFNAQKSRFGF